MLSNVRAAYLGDRVRLSGSSPVHDTVLYLIPRDTLMAPCASTTTVFLGRTPMLEISGLEFHVTSHGLDGCATICLRLLCVWYVSGSLGVIVLLSDTTCRSLTFSLFRIDVPRARG